MTNVETIHKCIYRYYILVSHLIYRAHYTMNQSSCPTGKMHVKCKYHKHIRLYTIKISSKTILFIKTHGSKGKGGGRPRGQGRRAAARGRGRGQGGRGRAAAGQNRIELAMQARQNRQTQIEVHDLKYVSLPYTYTKERTTRSLIKNKFITCMEHIC